jgi:hypothetical protein
MRNAGRRIAVLAAFVALVSGLSITSRQIGPAAASEQVVSGATQTVPVGSSMGSVTLSIGTNHVFRQASCLFIPLTVTWDKAPAATVIGALSVVKAGAAQGNDDSFTLVPADPAQGTLEDFVWVCPVDGPGAYTLQGSLTFIGPAATEVSTVPPLAFSVAAARTRMAPIAVTIKGGHTTVRGSAQAGAGPAGGVLVISVRARGSRDWVNLAVPPIRASGTFSATIHVPLTPGTKIRAQVRLCRWCTGAQQLATISH